ncbi:hypothetical protein KIN20_020742 [Parelaphostrongylus tenuis]|uniref:Uncharacterized protein n=1 Tax=Parelaphostrongylus tenuis TaxID=148309 RepID=A0AAD5QR23_PARTN|nr:hypothetical protein KIN20_020742 [Parelaphostrongylus tenuis]
MPGQSRGHVEHLQVADKEIRRSHRHREEHLYLGVIIENLDAKIGPRKAPEGHHINTHGLE